MRQSPYYYPVTRNPKRWQWAQGMTRRVFTDASNSGANAFCAGFVHVKSSDASRHIWACNTKSLFKATDENGKVWSGTRLYRFDSNFSTEGIEGLFVSSGGDIFVTGGKGNCIVVAVGKGDAADTAFEPGDFVQIRCNDGNVNHPFIPGIDIGDGVDIDGVPDPLHAETGWAPNQWSFWEVEATDAAKGGLAAGDIILSTYHRSNTPNLNAAFIYVMRKIGGVWHINADPTTKLPSTTATTVTCGDPFRKWNTTYARVCKHIHHIALDDDGYLCFSSGDSQSPYTITSSASSGGVIQITTALAKHRLPTGTIVFVSGHSAAAANGQFAIEAVGDNTFKLTGSTWAANGTGGTFTTRLAAGDTGSLYRYWRMIPDNTGAAVVTLLTTTGDQGYTSLLLLDDRGFILGGNDSATQGTGTSMYIDLWQHEIHVERLYTAGRADFDWPIFDMVYAETNDTIYAAVQRNNSGAYPSSHGGLLKAPMNIVDPAQIEFTTAVESSVRAYQKDWCDVDRIFSNRRRRIPDGMTNLIITAQPAGNTTAGYFYTMDF